MDFLKTLNLYGRLSLLGIIIFPWLTIFQGFHHVDEGFIITNAYYFLSHPESIYYGFGHYLTDFIGWGMSKIFGNFGLISFRIGYILILYGTFIGTFLVLRDLVSKNLIFFGFLIAYFFTNNVDTINWVNYYPVTTLFYIWALYFFWKGLSNKSTLNLFLTGIILGIGVFARLPNIVSVAIIGLIPIYFLLRGLAKYTIGLTLYSSSIVIIGFLMGIGMILYMAYTVGHIPYLGEVIKIIAGMAGEGAETKNHGIGYLLTVYGKSFLFVVTISFLTSVGVWISYLLGKRLRLIRLPYFISFIIGGLLGTISILKFYYEYILFGHNIFVSYVSFIFPFLSIYVGILSLRAGRKDDPSIFFILGIFLMIFIPLGGGGYLEMMQNAGFVLFPLTLQYLYNQHKEFSNSFSKYTLPLSLLIIIIISAFLSTIHIVWKNNYPFTYINYGKIKYLNIEGATLKEMETIEQTIIQPFPNQKWLFLSNFGYASYLYYIYDIKPYLGNSVPAYYPVEIYKKKLISELDTGKTPIIVIDKFHNISKENTYRKHGENMEKITFEILEKKSIIFEKILETNNFIFYKTFPYEKIY